MLILFLKDRFQNYWLENLFKSKSLISYELTTWDRTLCCWFQDGNSALFTFLLAFYSFYVPLNYFMVFFESGLITLIILNLLGLSVEKMFKVNIPWIIYYGSLHLHLHMLYDITYQVSQLEVSLLFFYDVCKVELCQITCKRIELISPWDFLRTPR